MKPPVPLPVEDFETVCALTSPDTAQAIATARRLMVSGEFDEALILLASKLAVMDLRYQDAEALLAVLFTHVLSYAKAIDDGLVPAGEMEQQAVGRVLEFVADVRPATTLAQLVYRVKRLAVADAAALFSIDN